MILSIALVLPMLSYGQLADSNQRLVHMQGALNFRDIGGYKTTDGKEVKWGKLFRSASISKLTDDDMVVMEQKKIHTVIDLRGNAESAAAPDRLLPGTDYTLCPAGSDSLPDAKRMADRLKQGGFLEKIYGTEGVKYFGDRYRSLFVKLISLNEDEAVLYHCTGGRDRTGMATALVLYVLGVPQETIEADFVASNVYLVPMMSQTRASMAKASGLSEEQVRKEMDLRPALIHSFFDAIRSNYGSVENFLQREMGIGEKERNLLKEKYTTG